MKDKEADDDENNELLEKNHKNLKNGSTINTGDKYCAIQDRNAKNKPARVDSRSSRTLLDQ